MGGAGLDYGAMKPPPRLAKAVVRRCVPKGLYRDSALGDLEECFCRYQLERGYKRAVLWYWMQAVRLALRYMVERCFNGRAYREAGGGVCSRRNPMNSVVQDLRFALRMLRRRPLFSVVAIMTLGLGIGAATAMFSVVDGVLLKPLPYHEPDRLVAIWQTWPPARGTPGDDGARWDRYRLAYDQVRELSEHNTVFEGIAAYRAGNPDVARLTGVGDPVEVPAGAASASLLHLLGVSPLLGRWFLPEEEASRAGDDGAPVVVLSYELWQSRLGGSQATLGSTITVDDRQFTIVGILPPGFQIQWLSASIAGEGITERRDLWFPIGAPGWGAGPWSYSWETIGRLASGASLERAGAESQTVLAGHRNTDPEGEVRVIPRAAEESRGIGAPLVLLLGATGVLLLIACSNIAMLSMAETLSRRHELATRSALGAGTFRIVHMHLTESLVLGLLSSLVGVLLAYGCTSLLGVLAPPIPRLDQVGVDLRVLGFAALVGVLAALLFGTVPSVLGSVRGDRRRTARLTSTKSPSRRRVSQVIVGMEVALTAILLIAGGLLVRSLSQLLAVDIGFDTNKLATIEVVLPETRYPNDPGRAEFFETVLARLGAIPGIGSVSGVSRLPFPGYTSTWRIEIEGRDEYYGPLGYQVAPGYLEMLGVPLLAGRTLTAADGPEAPLAVVINETMARRYWPDESPIGKQFLWGGSDGPVTVVGIVADMKRQRLYAETEPAFFIPFSQHPDENACFVARTELDPKDMIPLMREALWSVDSELAVRNATTIDALVDASADRERYGSFLVCAFAFLAALLAAAGVFGITARTVAAQTREMGIRMALGAGHTGLVGTTVRSVTVTGLAGTAVGLVSALWVSHLLVEFLFGISSFDPATYAAVTAFIVVMCLVASYFPARRITRVNPVEVLRAE